MSWQKEPSFHRPPRPKPSSPRTTLASGVYVNFLGSDEHDRVREAYRDRTYQRLIALKSRWDPANLFQVNQNITPHPLDAAGGPACLL